MKHKAPNRLTRTSAQVEGFLKLHGVEKKAAPSKTYLIFVLLETTYTTQIHLIYPNPFSLIFKEFC